MRIDLLAAALARGETVAAASVAAGITSRTAFRWLQDDDFRQRVNDERARLMDSTTGLLTSAAVEAAKVLAELLKAAPGIDNKLRLMAAKAVIHLQLQLTNLVTLERRLAKLERDQED